MSKIALVTDSTAYLTAEEVARYGVTVIPLTVNFEDGFIYDEIVDTKEFFARIDRAGKLPFTSQPAGGQFTEVYRRLLDQGKEVISIHVSSKLSGTFESAQAAADGVDSGKITVIDSLSSSAPLAFLVLAAARWAEEGLNRAWGGRRGWHARRGLLARIPAWSGFPKPQAHRAEAVERLKGMMP